MGRSLVGRATFSAAIVGLLSAQVIAGCGSTKDAGNQGATGGRNEGGSAEVEGGTPGEAGEPGSGGTTGGAFTTGGRASGGAGGMGSGAVGGKATASGGKAGFGGDIGTGGLVGAGGTGAAPSGGSGGLPATGGVPGTGGASGCVEGTPCNCKKLVGITECDAAGEATCSCPPAAECAAKADPSCFEPCGGEPFGAWILEETCFSGMASGINNPSCEKISSGTGDDSDLRMRLLDGGDMQLLGREAWTLNARVSLSCLQVSSVNSCPLAFYWPGALLFSQASSLKCEANACGVCDCAGDVQGVPSSFNFGRWSRDDTTLQLGNISVPYCVTGEELWVGGGGNGEAGDAKVSYKFKKQSCSGTPKACAARTAAECGMDGNCSVGECKPTTGTTPRCATAGTASDCGVLQGCTWDPKGCSGVAPEACEFQMCGTVPGCTWGAPRERCGGYTIPCEERDLDHCKSDGCSVHVCQPNFSDFGECGLLTNATDCGKAPGCTFSAGACTGQPQCIAQTDVAICQKIQCSSGEFCAGTPTECATFSVAKCHDAPGCRLEW